MEEYKLSVIVPVYNAEKKLSKCIESITNQTYKNLEIILIDDGSTDNSLKICTDYKEKDNRIKVIHCENGGVSKARNIGLKNCTGDLVTFIDSDDFIDVNTYEKCINIFNDYNVDSVRFNAVLQKESNSKPLKIPYKSDGIHSKIQIVEWFADYELLGSVCCLIIKKKIIDNIFFNETLHLR